jgi:leucyl-tRNA synthetase
MSRWMKRVWNLVLDDYNPAAAGSNDDVELVRMTHRTIKKATEDIERIRFNTMVAALMEFTNYLGKVKESGAVSLEVWTESVKTLLLLLAPAAPHLVEELWHQRDYDYSIHSQAWPEWDEALIKEEEITLVVQVNGKVRDKLTVAASISESEAKKVAAQQPKVQTYLEGKQVVNIIYVPGRLVNIVVK